MKNKNNSENFFLSLKESFLIEQSNDDEEQKNKQNNLPKPDETTELLPPFKELEKKPLKKEADIVPEVPDQEFVSALEEDLELCNEEDPFWDEI